MDNAENQAAQVEPELAPVETEVIEAEETQATPETQGSVPLKAHVKLRERAQAAEDKLLEMERRTAAMEQERNLAALAIRQPQAEPEEEAELIAPNPYDYASDDEWVVAQRQYSKQLTERMKADLTKVYRDNQQADKQSQAEAEAKAQQDSAYSKAREDYLDRAEKLNAPDFLEAEDKMLTVWSKSFLNHVIANIPNSEQVIYTLSQDLGKAGELADAVDRNMLSGGTELVKYAAELGKPNKGVLPEPDEPITGGAGGVVDIEGQIDKLRAQKLAGKLTMQQFMDKKTALTRKAS
jgi:hypothetical protein